MAEATNLKKNYLLNTGNQLLSLIVPLITAPYLSRILTSDGIGIQSYTNSIDRKSTRLNSSHCG